ncbi:hypothetical protein [Macrococcoides caseolyticum]|uniref:hypothetical protein n=1 Tax=Macrococcoides caseolyticum TaxID=69966 RepID=UPI001F231B97|nr:hypothetical protein [Macrococcus caseolyticus]MCE4957248.1 hypothetical protein [Macrococcus caseolyticus]
MTILSTETFYYIARKKLENEVEKIEPIYYDPTNRIYSPTMEYQFATKYATAEEAKRRVDVLNMLAEIDGLHEHGVEYITVKFVKTVEEVVPTV